MTTPDPLAEAQAYLSALKAARLAFVSRGAVEQVAFAGQSTTFTDLESLNVAIRDAEREVGRLSGRRPRFLAADFRGGCS